MSLGGLINYDGPTQAQGGYYAEQSMAGMARTPSIKQRLDLAVEQAEAKLVAVKRAREIFEKYPDIEELLNIFQRGVF